MKGYFSLIFLIRGIFSLLFIPLGCAGQENINSKFEYQKEFNLDNDLGDAIRKNRISMSWPLMAWYNLNEKSIDIYNIQTQETETIKVKGKWHKVFISSKWIIDVADVGSENKITRYSKGERSWVADSTWKVEHSIENVFCSKNGIRLGSFYVGEKPFIECRELRYNLENFSYPIMLHTKPKKYIDFTESHSLICDPGKYEISILNNNLERHSLIKNSNSDFAGINDDLYVEIEREYKGNSPSDSFAKLRKLESCSDNVWSAEFVTDSIVLVKRTNNYGNEPSRLKMEFDIWVYNGFWQLQEEGLNNRFPDPEEVIGENCHSFQLGEFSSRYFFESGNLYVVKVEPPKSFQGMSYGEFKSFSDNYFFENELNYKLYVYKVVL